MNTNTRAKLKQTLKTQGAKAVKKAATENYGIEKPAHRGKMVVAQAVVNEALSEVEQEARQLVENLGLNLAVKGRLLSVIDGEGEYITHAFAWGQLILNLQAWFCSQAEELETARRIFYNRLDKYEENLGIGEESTPSESIQPEPAQSESAKEKEVAKPQPRNVYMLQNWQSENMAVRLADDSDSGNSAPTKDVVVYLKDGRQKKIGSIQAGIRGTLLACSGLWLVPIHPTDEDMDFVISVMLSKHSIKESDFAHIPFDSLRYLGF